MGEKGKESGRQSALDIDRGVAIVVEPSDRPVNGSWRTSLTSCNSDEETCWWGNWCCWLVQGRTAQSFEVDTSKTQITYFWGYILAVMLTAMLFGLAFAILFAILGSIMLAVNRAVLRQAIRTKLNIDGSFCSDFLVHCLCPTCAICQEARESKLVPNRALDFCSGEGLLSEEEAYERATGYGRGGVTAENTAAGDKFLTHLKSVSKTSHIILVISAAVTFISFVMLIQVNRSQNIGVLILVFVQPLLILYFVYWRTRRQHTSLDLVIKCYAVGFWFTTTQSVVLEGILQMLIGAVIGIGVLNIDPSTPPAGSLISGLNSHSTNIFSQHSNANEVMSSITQQTLLTAFTRLSVVHNSLFYSAPHSMYLGSSPSPGVTLMGYGWDGFMHAGAGVGIDDDLSRTAATGDMSLQAMMQTHAIAVFISLFLMAFVVAAGVEETMKHFVVRCCPFPTPLKDPYSVLVYMMSGALGFATFENIEYIFGTAVSPIPGTSMVVGELVVLLIRVLMPIHVICSVMQATNLSKVLTGKEEMSLFRILLPALLLHGSFDFVLFASGAISYMYDIDSAALEVSSIALVAALTIGGAIYARRGYKKVEDDFENGYGAFATDEDVVEVVLRP